jgi:hypothetical protein
MNTRRIVIDLLLGVFVANMSGVALSPFLAVNTEDIGGTVSIAADLGTHF